MSQPGEPRWSYRKTFPLRVVLFVAIVVLIQIAEHGFQSWQLPTASAELAVAQLEPSNADAEALRTFEWARTTIPLVTWGLMAAAACAVFLRVPRHWMRSLKRHLT